MLRNLLIMLLLYIGYQVIRRFMASGLRRRTGAHFTSRHPNDRNSYPGAVDAEFEELDDKGS